MPAFRVSFKNSYINGVFIWEVYLQDHVWIICLYVVDTVNEGLVHVKNECFLF